MTGNRTTETKGTHPVRWRKKPVVIEAMHFHSAGRECIGPIQAWISREGGQSTWHYAVTSNEFQIKTLEGWHTATLGDYIIRGVHGEFYPCKPDIFAKTYEAPEQPPEPRAEQALPDDVAYFIRTVHSCLNVSGYGVAIGSPLADRAKALNERYSLTKDTQHGPG